MAPVGTYWGSIRQPQTRIILSIAALNGLELEQPEWDFSKKPDGFTTKFPYGKIPAFEGADGFKLIESIPIARYFCGLGTKVNLLGSDAKEIALVDQWVHFAEQEIGNPSQSIMGVIYGFHGPFNRESLEKHTERLVRSLKYVESYLATRPSGYLVSNSVTLADFALAGMVYAATFTALGATERASYPNVFSHYDKVTADEKIKQFWGKEHFTEVAATEPKTLPQH